MERSELVGVVMPRTLITRDARSPWLRCWLAAPCAAIFIASAGCTAAAPVDSERIEPVRPIFLTPEARFPEAEGATVDVFDDRLVFNYPVAPDPPLAVGQIVAGGASEGYLRRVLSVANTGAGIFELTTEQAAIPDVIADGAFNIHIPWDSTREENAAAAVAPLISEDFLELLADVFEPDDGSPICVGAAGVFLHPHVSFQPRIVDGLLDSRGGDTYGNIGFAAHAEIGFDLQVADGVAVRCQQDLIEFLQRRRVAIPRYRRNGFGFVYAVPVWYTLIVEPVLHWSITTSVTGERLTYSVRGTADIGVGLERLPTDTGWNPTRQFELGQSQTVTRMGETRGHVAGEITIGVRVRLRVWGAELPGSVSLAAVPNADVDVTTCDWDAAGNLRVELSAELKPSELTRRLHGVPDVTVGPWVLYDTHDQMSGWSAGDLFEGCSVPDPCAAAQGCDACVAVDGCAYCPTTDECVPAAVVGATCADARATAAACHECFLPPGVCDIDLDCCGAGPTSSMHCIDRQCADVSMCAQQGEQCSDGVRPCCSESLGCAPDSAAMDVTACCHVVGAACASTGDCCGTMECVSGQCAGHPFGAACTTNWECGDGTHCVNGLCTYG